jgi:predicted transcriptional regulator/ADP-ribose pyrophosphatase YjhB (NUDIX family)
MIDNQQLHKAQVSILDALRHTEEARFSDLMRPTGLTSDTFKFHIRKLVHAGIAEKTEAGTYRLTQRGKEVVNTINRETKAPRKQPKLSVILVVSRQRANNETEYLVQQRFRNPFYHYWGFITGPMQWSEEPEITAGREYKKQTNKEAAFSVRAFYRERDYDATHNEPLEDKLLTVLSVQLLDNEPLEDWSGGHNAWMTMHELQGQEKYFASCLEIVAMVEQGKTYASRSKQVTPDSY